MMFQYNLLRSRSIFNSVKLNARSFSIHPFASKNISPRLQIPESNLLLKNIKIVSPFHTSCLSYNKENEDPQHEDEKMKDKTVPLGKRLTIVAICLSMCGVAYYFTMTKDKELKTVKREEQMTKVDIGAADYDLTDHTGKSVSKKDFLGKWLLLYFGFTHCPDICPEELEKMAEIVDDVDSDPSIPDIQPIFISVDPDRDTPEAISEYIKEFHKKFIGLTGSMDQIKQATKAFRVYFSNGPKDDDNDYIVDHTIVMYLMNPQGNFVDYYGSRSVAKEKIVSGIKKNMKNYARLHG